MSSEKPKSDIEILPPLEKGEPFNKESLRKEYDQLLDVYNDLQRLGQIPGTALDIVPQRKVTLIKMRELALQLNLQEKVSWIEERMKLFSIPIPE